MRMWLTTAAVAALAISGCGGSSDADQQPDDTAASSTPTKCCVAGASPHLRIAVTPERGPAGTHVQVIVTGCEDSNGQNHAVSFNNDADNLSARTDPDTVRPVEVTQHGTRLVGSYAVVSGDQTGGRGMFVAQCGQTSRQHRFTVTG